MAYKKYNPNDYTINYSKRILESYKIMEEEGLNFKLAKVQVPYYDLYTKLGQPGEVIHDIPIYAVMEDTTEKTDGTDEGTCYDDSILVKLESFKNMNAKATQCYIKVSSPLYDKLEEKGLILE